MNKTAKGKKLLVLGGAPNETTLVKRAQELGAYVIVADYYTDRRLSPAKDFADEAWDVNWTDIDMMVTLCRNAGVDGITAGYSEVKIEYLIKLCRALDLPCYCTEEQLEVTRDKVRFKDLCRRCGVPTVKQFASIDEVDAFPVIVKPTDRAGSIGVGIAKNRDELMRVYKEALDKSYTKNVIIEEYITDRKIDAYYLIDDGNISLLTSNDVIMAQNNNMQKVVQSCWLYPHRELDQFNKKVDEKLRNMIRTMGINYGCIFFSGFIDEKKEYKFFECGFRLEGAHQYNYTYNVGKVNFLDVFILHAIFGNLDKLEKKQSPNRNLKLGIINFYLKEGRISHIKGIDHIQNMQDCSLFLLKANVGDFCKDGAILTKVAMAEFNNENSDSIAADMKEAYEHFKVFDEAGNDMLFDRVDTELVANWWNGENTDKG